MHNRLTLTCTLSLLALSGCGSAGTDPTPVRPGSISLAAANTVLVPGLGAQLTWIVKDADGQPVADPTITFTTNPVGVVSVSATGAVLGLAPGSVTITGRSGQLSANLLFSVQEGGVVDMAGGVLQGFGGAIVLEVPAGAVSAPVAITLDHGSNPLLDPTADAASIYTIGTGGQAFSTPATLRLRFNPANGPLGLPADAYRIRIFGGSAWSAAPQGSSDGASIASGAITEGGLFSVGWADPETPCVGAEYRQFDFWLGAWTVTAGGQPNGDSDITATPSGCAIFEHYRTLGGGVGRSINFYQPGTGLWYQTYVDNQNHRLVLSGTRSGNVMSLYFQGQGNQVERWNWSLEIGGTVRQVATLSTDGGNTYGAPSWNGLYTRK